MHVWMQGPGRDSEICNVLFNYVVCCCNVLCVVL